MCWTPLYASKRPHCVFPFSFLIINFKCQCKVIFVDTDCSIFINGKYNNGVGDLLTYIYIFAICQSEEVKGQGQ